MAQNNESVVSPRLKPGDHVRLVSPASTPDRDLVAKTKAMLEGLGLIVEIGHHAFDEWGYMAGRDEDRLADINDAFRDPGVKAVIATRGGKGAYRIADKLDFDALRQNPKLLVGFSEITILHLAIWKHCKLTAIHGAAWGEDFDKAAAESFRKAVFTTDQVTIAARESEPTSALTTSGTATGILVGGNQDMISTAAGWILPRLNGVILLLEDVDKRLGFIDRQLTMLEKGGYLKGIAGIAVGQYYKCGGDETTKGDWTAVDVLRDQLMRLDVPILGGLPLGHGHHPLAIPLGVVATIDTNTKTLSVEAGVSAE